MAVVQEKREVSGFDEIHLEGSGTLLLQQGDQDLLIIETEEYILPKIKSEVRDGRLTIGFKNWLDHVLQIGSPPITYHITMRQVHGISISGTGKLTAGQIQTDHLNLKISGSGELTLSGLQTGDLETAFSGSGKAQLNGEAQRHEIRISGSGDVFAEDLSSQETRVRISGSGNVRLRVSEKLEVHISGSGDVRYHGNPSVQPHISGSGKVRNMD